MTRTLVTLSEISTLRTGKLNSNAAVVGGAYPFFTCSKETFQIDKYAFDTEAVLLAGNNANGIFPLKYYKGQFNAYQRTYVIETKDPSVLSTRYLYYALRPALKHFEQASIGAATQYLTKGILDNFAIQLPDISQQNKIASILASYDDLIENNRRRIALLEDAARLLYREWFVHVRFPGHEHVKIVDGIPEGWSQTPLSELVTMVMGQSPKSEFYNTHGDGLPFHQGVTNYGFRFVTDTTYSTKVTKLAEPEDILFSVRAPVGRINVTLNKMILGRGLAAFRSKKGNQSFLLYQLKSHFFKEDLIGGGAIYAATNKKDLEKLELLQPTDELVGAFEQISRPIDDQICALSLQTDHLVNARDLLLPRLMDGRLEVAA